MFEKMKAILAMADRYISRYTRVVYYKLSDFKADLTDECFPFILLDTRLIILLEDRDWKLCQ